MTEDDIVKRLQAVLSFMSKNSDKMPPEDYASLIYAQIVELVVDIQDDMT